MSDEDIVLTMSKILGSMLGLIVLLIMVQKPLSKASTGIFLPSQESQPSKRAYELFVLCYTPIWIFAFGCIVAFGLYESFDEWSYMKVCVGLALPFLLQPVFYPSAGFDSPDEQRPLFERYAFKANLWLAMYSFIGTIGIPIVSRFMTKNSGSNCLSTSHPHMVTSTKSRFLLGP